MAEAEPTFHRPGEGENHEMGGSSLSIKATGEQTNGTFFLSETTVAPGFPGPPLHRHNELVDMFYVLEGTLTIQIEGRTEEAPAGSFFCAPPGVAHTFSNRSEAPVRFLNFNTPAGWENYMRDLAAAFKEAGGMPKPENIGPIAARYDFELATPPGDS